jgi:hypothetical protein
MFSRSEWRGQKSCLWDSKETGTTTASVVCIKNDPAFHEKACVCQGHRGGSRIPTRVIERAEPLRVGWSYHTTIPQRRRFRSILPWYNCVLNAINAAAPFLVATQATNLALLISAILKKRTLCLSELARAYPTPEERKTAAPKHDLLHRLKRLWRFIENERVDGPGHPGSLRSPRRRSARPSSLARLGHRLDNVRH